MDQIIYDKSFQQRLQEYLDLLSVHEILPASQIQKEWCYYLELVMDSVGWQAIWKIPRLDCEKLKISYPTIVLVYVENVQFKNLASEVKILAVQDDIHLPENHVVPLTQLWVTKQDNTICVNISDTANSLDMLRFFYNHLWMPWDIDNDDSIDWVTSNLEVRMRLYYDMKLGIIPRKMAEHIRSVISDAKKTQKKFERIEKELYDINYLKRDSNKNYLDDLMKEFVDLQMKMLQLKNEVNIFENPVMRERLLQKYKENGRNRKIKNKPEFWLIFKSGAVVDKYIEYLQKVKEILPNGSEIKTAISLNDALNHAFPNDTILFSPGKHRIHSTGNFEEGGNLKGLHKDNSKTIIENTNESIMLDFLGNALIENLSFLAEFVQCGIIIRKGSVRIKNCNLSGKGESSTHQGIIVLTGSEIILENCNIAGFCTGIVANSGSKLIMRNCSIFDINIAIKIFDGTLFDMKNCNFFNIAEYAIYLETEKNLFENKQQIGDITLFNSIPDIKFSECTFDENQSDVMIMQKRKIIPVKELFSNSAFDSTMYKLPLDTDDSEEEEDKEGVEEEEKEDKEEVEEEEDIN